MLITIDNIHIEIYNIHYLILITERKVPTETTYPINKTNKNLSYSSYI